jgi:S-adenosyl-L-methionine hydrolase (adenosine-forming)
MITLTSDFGLKDPYVAEMKGVILSINSKATIVDITHNIEKFNIRMASFMLASAAPYFPQGTVHLAVVDPEVGTNRRAILIENQKGFFVGPDNGILVLAAQSKGIKHVYQLTNPKFMLPKVSDTFHGRDVFAPVAAHLEMGVQPNKFGPEIKDHVQPEFTTTKKEANSVCGEVLHTDRFGNVITNITSRDLDKDIAETVTVELPEVTLKLPFGKTYAQAKSEQPIAVIGSHGFLEIALNQGNAAEKFHAKAGDRILVKSS